MFGFILTRHVTSKETNLLWIHAVVKIRASYPNVPIVVIDDNSNYQFVSPNVPNINITYIRSEYPRRGELLPYYYLCKHQWFPKAVILHDSIFIHTAIPEFESRENTALWHFTHPIHADFETEKRFLSALDNSGPLLERHTAKKFTGMFGVMSVVTLEFVQRLESKYKISKLLDLISTRPQRMCLERVMGVIFTEESNPQLVAPFSIFGTIHEYCRWGITMQEYMRTKPQRPVTKVWSGR